MRACTRICVILAMWKNLGQFYLYSAENIYNKRRIKKHRYWKATEHYTIYKYIVSLALSRSCCGFFPAEYGKVCRIFVNWSFQLIAVHRTEWLLDDLEHGMNYQRLHTLDEHTHRNCCSQKNAFICRIIRVYDTGFNRNSHYFGWYWKLVVVFFFANGVKYNKISVCKRMNGAKLNRIHSFAVE